MVGVSMSAFARIHIHVVVERVMLSTTMEELVQVGTPYVSFKLTVLICEEYGGPKGKA